MSDIWQPLNHDSILTMLEQVMGIKLSNLLIQRNSYINRVFEFGEKQAKEKFIVKFYRPGRWTLPMIEDEHRFLYQLEEYELPVIAPLRYQEQSLFDLKGIPFALFPKKGGRALDELDEESWQLVGRLLGRVHQVGKSMKIVGRPLWKPDLVCERYLNTLLPHLPTEHRTVLENLSRQFVQKAQPLFEHEELLLIHGDCHCGNLMHRPGEGTYLIDFDDIVTGPVVQDMWMLLPGEPQECEHELNWLLSGYELFRPFNQQSLRLVPALRVMRMLHYAAWCAMQSQDAQFATHFPDWGQPRYWNELLRDIQTQVETMPVR